MTEKEGTMPEKITYLGLCLSCERTLTCALPRDPKRPVWHCEECNGSKAPLGNPVTEKKETMPEKITYLGLCLYCDRTLTCALPRDPKRPVWHCEECNGSKAPFSI